MGRKRNSNNFYISGKEISEMVNENLKPGTYNVRFDGSKLSSRSYLYKIVSIDFVEIQKMILIK